MPLLISLKLLKIKLLAKLCYLSPLQKSMFPISILRFSIIDFAFDSSHWYRAYTVRYCGYGLLFYHRWAILVHPFFLYSPFPKKQIQNKLKNLVAWKIYVVIISKILIFSMETDTEVSSNIYTFHTQVGVVWRGRCGEFQ
jgi:hypothetical protein